MFCTRVPPHIFALVATLLAFTPSMALAAPPEVHWGPEENLEAIDLSLIKSATKTLDVAAFVLSDGRIADALLAARGRGVAIRIVIDRSERKFDHLEGLEDVTRIKQGHELMHEKSYAIDGTVLRIGSANFSVSGEVYQSNDLVVIRDAAIAARFEHMFNALFEAGEPTE